MTLSCARSTALTPVCSRSATAALPSAGAWSGPSFRSSSWSWASSRASPRSPNPSSSRRKIPRTSSQRVKGVHRIRTTLSASSFSLSSNLYMMLLNLCVSGHFLTKIFIYLIHYSGSLWKTQWEQLDFPLERDSLCFQRSHIQEDYLFCYLIQSSIYHNGGE